MSEDTKYNDPLWCASSYGHRQMTVDGETLWVVTNGHIAIAQPREPNEVQELAEKGVPDVVAGWLTRPDIQPTGTIATERIIDAGKGREWMPKPCDPTCGESGDDCVRTCDCECCECEQDCCMEGEPDWCSEYCEDGIAWPAPRDVTVDGFGADLRYLTWLAMLTDGPIEVWVPSPVLDGAALFISGDTRAILMSRKPGGDSITIALTA